MFRKVSAIAVFILFLSPRPLWAEDFAARFTEISPPQALPDFVFEDGRGQSLRLADFRGHAILLNFWASWCPPCVEELPSLDALQTGLGAPNIMVVAIDEERNGADAIKTFFKRHGVKNLSVYRDTSGRIAASVLHAHGLPTTFLINAAGHAIGRIDGDVDWTSPDTAAFLRKNLLTP